MGRTLPRNDDLAAVFELLADLLELDGADAFRLQAYRRAATRIRESAVPVAQLALEGKATGLSGIGGTIQGKIVEYSDTGDLTALAKLRDHIPPGLVEVMHVPGLGPKTARRLWQELGVTSADELRQAAEAHRLRELPGLGAKTEEKVLEALADVKASADGKHSGGRFSVARSRSWQASSTSFRPTLPPIASPRRAACAGGPRPCATSTSLRQPRMPRR